jgi:HemY protein
MIRIVFFLIIVGALSIGVAWLADRPGDVVITWQGLRIETSLMVSGAAVLVLMTLLGIIWSIIRAVVRSPFVLARLRRHRRGERAYEAISNGLIAIGAGDVTAAHKHSGDVNRIAPGEPLALLLTAQTAQLTGDRDAADRAFRAMASRDDTKALGLHGLFVEAHRRNDPVSARAYAEEAARTAPTLGWAARAVLEFRSAAGDWTGALALLERGKRALEKAVYRRHRAVLLTAQAMAGQDSDRDNAKQAVLEAVKLEPTLVPAASLAGRMLAEAGELRKASRIVAKAWRANPHPDLAQTYSELRFGDAARDRLARVEALIKKTPGHIESALAMARAALDAREFGKARAALAPYLSALSRRGALLMAELERAERNDEGRAREWMARALHAAPDPQWTADGHVSDHWHPVSPVTGRLDAFEWRVPLTGVVTAPVIEPEAPGVAAVEAPPSRAMPAPAQINEPPPAAAAPAPGPNRRPNSRTQPKAEPVIPLVHAPDDPGPESPDEG